MSESIFDEITKSISRYDSPELGSLKPLPDMEVAVEMSARVNFGGVFTDIPPYCYENGGKVINAPVLLNGGYPLRARVKSIDKPGYLFRSIDAGRYCYIEDLKQEGSVLENEIFRLHKAICKVCGISGGLSITTESLLPYGSGLGTSSILAAAVIKGVYELYSFEHEDDYIVNKVFVIEQLLGSRGGWQDQCGGLYGGFKVCVSEPGLPQRIRIEPIAIDPAIQRELSGRLVILYSDTTRKSGNILMDIARDYIDGDSRVHEAYSETVRVADEMKTALSNGDLNNFGGLMSRQHELNKQLCSNHSTPEIDRIILDLKDISEGAMISGAGGGGYITLLLKKGIVRNERVALGLNRKPYNVVYETV